MQRKNTVSVSDKQCTHRQCVSCIYQGGYWSIGNFKVSIILLYDTISISMKARLMKSYMLFAWYRSRFSRSKDATVQVDVFQHQGQGRDCTFALCHRWSGVRRRPLGSWWTMAEGQAGWVMFNRCGLYTLKRGDTYLRGWERSHLGWDGHDV